MTVFALLVYELERAIVREFMDLGAKATWMGRWRILEGVAYGALSV